MDRNKNALTEHHIAPMPTDETDPEYLRLAKWIHTVDPGSEEEDDDQAYYDGDGTPETEIVSVKKTWAFDGFYYDEDPAHQFLRSIENKAGNARKVMYKQVRQNGDVLEAPATISELITTGGPAEEYEPLKGTIKWNREPELTKADTTPEG